MVKRGIPKDEVDNDCNGDDAYDAGDNDDDDDEVEILCLLSRNGGLL